MNKQTVKTTRIEKRYKDKKTGETKSITIDYAKVVDRINEFRESNPRGLIETTPSIINDMVFFKARILKDKSDEYSAEATGHAVSKNDGSDKLFEKLETLAVGRALAMLGYAAGGEVASSEEMEGFFAYREEKLQDAIEVLESATSMVDLKEKFMTLGSLIAEKRIIEAKDKKKAEFSK